MNFELHEITLPSESELNKISTIEPSNLSILTTLLEFNSANET
jgi:hypothetical protein